jgi:hypothetical protein
MRQSLAILFISLALFSVAAPDGGLDTIAMRYVKLALQIGQYDPDFVDAYYGPAAWREEATREKQASLPQALEQEARALLAGLKRCRPEGPLERKRRAFLNGQVAAALTRLEMLAGRKLKFDEESLALYGAIAPGGAPRDSRELLAELERLLPGAGALPERLARFRERFVIPRGKVPAVFAAAIAECRRRTLKMVRLPKEENFACEYVKGAPWGAYNWYKGNYFSVIQVNTDLPVSIDRPLELAAHEGYPGHHLYNVLLEERLLKGRGWMEFSIYPLFSPESLIAEGTANYGVEVIFSRDERAEFETKTLYPLAGIDPKLAPTYRRVRQLLRELGRDGIDIARGYLDGAVSRGAAISWMMTYEFSSRERAEQSVRFWEKYRSYIINYSLGEELVRNYMARHGGGRDLTRRRKLFLGLLSEPVVPADLAAR